MFFDANSGAGTVTVSATSNTLGLNFTGFTGTFAGGSQVNIGASLTLGSGMTYSHTGALAMNGTTNANITLNGVLMTGSTFLLFKTGASVTLQSTGDFNTRTLTISATTDFIANGFDITTPSFSSSATTTVDISNVDVTVTGSVRPFHLGVNCTLTSTNSNIYVTGAIGTSGQITVKNGQFNNLFLQHTSGTIRVEGSNTFNALEISSGRSVLFQEGFTSTVSSLVAIGTSASPIVLGIYTPSYSNESLGTGNGVQTVFTGTLANFPIRAGSLVIHVQSASPAVNVGDDGAGNFTGDATGTINYVTGAYSLTFNNPVQNFRQIRAAYSDEVTGVWTISDTSGTNEVGHCEIEYSTATGGALFTAYSSTDDGGNTGWIFGPRNIIFNTGTYTYSGINWTMTTARQLLFDTGSYVYTGINWAMQKAFIFAFATGAYTYSGINWLMTATRQLLFATGSYTYTGIDWVGTRLYSFLFATGSYSYTGVNWLMNAFRQMSFATGSYTYNGVNWLMTTARQIFFDTGSYVYTGFDILLGKLYILAFATGSYAYTGVNWLMSKVYLMLFDTGVYIYRGFSWFKWQSLSRNVSTWARQTKNAATFTPKSKNSSVFTSRTKNSSTFTPKSKNSSTWTPKDRA